MKIKIKYIIAASIVLLAAFVIFNLGKVRLAIHNKRGADYYRKGMYDAAVAEFQKAIEIKPDYPEAHNNLGVIYRVKSMYNEAIGEFTEAIRLKPNFAIAHYNLARVYAQRNDKSAAIESLKNSIKLDNRYADLAQNEKAFDNIRESPEFQQMLGGEE